MLIFALITEKKECQCITRLPCLVHKTDCNTNWQHCLILKIESRHRNCYFFCAAEGVLDFYNHYFTESVILEKVV